MPFESDTVKIGGVTYRLGDGLSPETGPGTKPPSDGRDDGAQRPDIIAEVPGVTQPLPAIGQGAQNNHSPHGVNAVADIAEKAFEAVVAITTTKPTDTQQTNQPTVIETIRVPGPTTAGELLSHTSTPDPVDQLPLIASMQVDQPIPVSHPNTRRRGRAIAALCGVAALGLGAVAYIIYAGQAEGGDDARASADSSPHVTSTSTTREVTTEQTAAPAAALELIPLGPAQGIPIANVTMTFEGTAVVDTDPAPGWQSGVTTADGTMSFTQDVEIGVSASLTDQAIKVEDMPGAMKQVTVDLNKVDLATAIEPESYLPELTGDPEEPIPLLEDLVSLGTAPSADIMQGLKDVGMLSPEATTLETIIGSFDAGIPYLVHDANQRMIQDLVVGSGREALYMQLQNVLIDRYGLGNPAVVYNFIPVNPVDDPTVESPQAAAYAATVPASVADDAMQFDPTKPVISIQIDNPTGDVTTNESEG